MIKHAQLIIKASNQSVPFIMWRFCWMIVETEKSALGY